MTASPFTGTKYDFSDVYELDIKLTESQKSKSIKEYEQEFTLFEGQRFECFETVTGEDMTLTIHLFGNNNKIRYKGEFSNGFEFWFDYYGSSEEYMEYKIDCLDDSDAFIRYNGSEIELIAEAGEAYANMYQYSGTYIGLPDTIEE